MRRVHPSQLSGILGSLLTAVAIGCGGSTTPDKPQAHRASFQGLVLSVVMPEGPVAEAIDEARGEWEGRTGATVELRKLAPGAFRGAVVPGSDAERLADAVVVYPAEWMGLVQEKVGLRPLPDWVSRDAAEGWTPDSVTRAADQGQAVDWSDICQSYRQRLLRWGRQARAVPVAGDTWLCYYRRDWLEAADHRDAFRARFGRDLAPPTTWTDYLDIAAYFHAAGKSESGPAKYGLVEPWGDRVARRLCWLAHCAAYVKHPDTYSLLFDLATMRARLADAGFVIGANQMRKAGAWGPPDMTRMDRDGARKLFLNGQAALCLAGTDLPLRAMADEQGATLAKIGVCPLPGSNRMVDAGTGRLRTSGRVNQVAFVGHTAMLASVTAGASEPEAAFHLLAFLSGKETAAAEVGAGQIRCGVYRRSQLEPGLWTDAGLAEPFASGYLDALGKSLQQTNTVGPLRLPQAEAYLADLDRALSTALSEQTAIQSLLKKLADQWDKRTDSLGRKAQIAHLRRSLGLSDVTD